MSQRQSRQLTVDSPAGVAAVSAELATPARRSALVLVACLFALWTFALAAMALFTSNPATISPDQIRKADVVVLGRPVPNQRGRIHIDRVLAGELGGARELTVLNLPDQPALVPEYVYVLPLSTFRGDYQVTVLGKGQQAPPLIYPAARSTIEQVRQILANAR